MKIYSAAELDVMELRALALRKSAETQLEEIRRHRAALSDTEKGLTGNCLKAEQRKSDLLKALIAKKMRAKK